VPNAAEPIQKALVNIETARPAASAASHRSGSARLAASVTASSAIPWSAPHLIASGRNSTDARSGMSSSTDHESAPANVAGGGAAMVLGAAFAFFAFMVRGSAPTHVLIGIPVALVISLVGLLEARAAEYPASIARDIVLAVLAALIVAGVSLGTYAQVRYVT